MPTSALKPCTYPGCPELVSKGYCEKHQPVIQAGRQAQHPEWQRLYNCARWKQIRSRVLARDPWCVECLSAGLYVPATECDHIEPHRGDVHKFFSGPFQSLCTPCHSRKTAYEVNGRGGEKVSTWRTTSAGGHPREINSQCEKFVK